MHTLLTPNRLHSSCTTSLVKSQIIICHKMQRSTEDVKVVVVQDVGHSVSSCILCHEGHGVSGEVVGDHEDIYHFRLLLQLLFAVTTDLDFGEV